MIFYFLQLIITPSLAIFTNSASYNALRHWCFLYPPLIIFSAYVVDNILLNTSSIIFNKIAKYIVAIFSFLSVTDNLLIMPYSNLSFNLYGRQFVKEENTDIDYWGYSSGELFRKKLIKGYKVTSSEEPFKTGNNHLPHHIKDEDQIYPLLLAGNNKWDFSNIENKCNVNIQSVSRNLLFRKEPLVFSKVGICPLFESNYWRVWSLNDGSINVESVSNKLIINQNSLNVLKLRRLKEEQTKDGKKLVLLFEDQGQFSLEYFFLEKNQLLNKSYTLSNDQEIDSNLKDNNYTYPEGLDIDVYKDWELGFKYFELKEDLIYSDENAELFTLDNKYTGIICKRKNQKSLKKILKNETGEYIYRKGGKAGKFSFEKGECLKNQNNELEKIAIYDSNKYFIYRWELDLNGVLLKSERI